MMHVLIECILIMECRTTYNEKNEMIGTINGRESV